MHSVPVITDSDILTPYGHGVDLCFNALMSGKSAISDISRFRAGAFFSQVGATVQGLSYHEGMSLVMQMLEPLFEGFKGSTPHDARLLLATTKGEIDLLEKAVLTGEGDPAESRLEKLLAKVVGMSGADGDGMVVSAACTSSSVAVARGASMIRNGLTDCVLVVACDSLTEFVYSGFSSLMALDKLPARPFDRGRAGLSVGEAAGLMLLMSEERAVREERRIACRIAGWGISNDANHMTGPSRESEGLIRAINSAFESSGIEKEGIGFISAHGTGTPYNDQMEIRAFRSIFGDAALPTYGIKGGIGHTMGAAGLLETAVAAKAMSENVIPPTVNLLEPDNDAAGWVSTLPQPVRPGTAALVTNAGFNGVNSALLLA